MANCECLEGCPFFNDRMEKMPSTANIIKKTFCLGTYEGCARYMVFKAKGKPAVPLDLFPNDTKRAESILGS